jgi:hypothetical protein
MAEVFKLLVDEKEMDFHCGTYATEKSLEGLGITLSGFIPALDTNFSSTIRHFIYFSAYDAQRLKTPKGHAVDFPYDVEDTFLWLEQWGGGNTPIIGTFTRKLLICVLGDIAGERIARVLVDGEAIDDLDKKKVIPAKKSTGKKTS